MARTDLEKRLCDTRRAQQAVGPADDAVEAQAQREPREVADIACRRDGNVHSLMTAAVQLPAQACKTSDHVTACNQLLLGS